MRDKIEVEVVVPCPSCGDDLSRGCAVLCDGTGLRRKGYLVPGSVASLAIAFAEAVLAFDATKGDEASGSPRESAHERMATAESAYRRAATGEGGANGID